MKKFLLFSCFIVLTTFVNKAFSQKWVEQMQDPNVNFYDVQKSFNDYYLDTEPNFRKSEKLKEVERAKLPAPAKSMLPVKGGLKPSVPDALAKGKMSGGWKAFKRWESYMTPRLYPSGDRSVMINAWNDYLNNYYGTSPGVAKSGGAGAAPTVMAANWSIIGPTTTIPTGGGGAGRVNFVRFDPTASTTIYVGSPGGGLWKSTNSGTTWSTGTDNLAVIGTTDLAIHPTNPLIQYLATGDGEAQDTYSIGVLKTTNGGTTWSPTGLTWLVTNGRTISRLLINPQNPNTIFAATSNGVYRSRNAGGAWTQIATAVSNMKDIEFKPGDTTIVYACSTTLFYKSTNAGTSFVTTSTGLPAAASLSRLSIAVTAANAAYVYVLASNTASGYQGLYRSTDSGATFTTRSTTPNILGYSSTGATAGGQGWYDLALAVSPLNADQVVVGGVNIWRSINGGTSWTLNAEWTGGAAPYVHADIHALEFLPGSGTTYFAGCDGGLFKTTTSGTAWSDLSNGLQISQAYRIGLSTTNANLLNTGWQDNGTARWNGGTSWSRPLGGDGMESIIDWSNASIQYGELYYGEINKTTSGGNYTTNIVASGGAGVNADGDWVTPYIEAPSNAATLFVGKAQVYKSTTGGLPAASWTQVGTISGGTGNLIALANAASNINYIYAAKIDKFYACTTGAAFVDRTAGLPVASAAITYIAVHPTNPSRVWVTFSGYSAANKVWYSADAGVTWTNYSTGLPNLPVNCIVYQTNNVTLDPLYVGTDVGVYYRDNTAGSWVAYNTGLPNVSVRELEIQYTALKLRAATFGRSIWQSDLYSIGTSPPTADFSANRVNICVGDCINFSDLSTGSPSSWSWTFTGAATTTSTLQNPTGICYNTAGTYSVSMTATNVNGGNTMTKTAYITVSGVVPLPLVEGFQGVTFVPTGWTLNNPDLDMTWAQITTVGGFSTSTSSAMMDNATPATSIAGTIDDMLTPRYNFTGVSTATMTFDVAYCRYNATYFDSLIVYVSTDCGSSWSRVYSNGGTGLATAPDNSTTLFTPTAAQWRTETVNMTPYAGMANVMLKYQSKSGWGQRLFLDNINISYVGAPVASVIIAQTTGTNPICAGATATFTATPTNGGTTPTYQWQVNGVNVGGATASTYTTTTLTTGQIVTCIMTSNLVGVAGSPATSNAITMVVTALPAAPTAGSSSPDCIGQTISLTANTIAGATYSWTGPSTFTSALEDPTRPLATAGMAGTYSVTVTVGGCTSLAGTTTVVLNPLPATPTASNTGAYCAGATISLSTPNVAGATYSWTGPSSFTSATRTPTIAAATTAMAGTYSVTITNASGCTSLAGTTTVVVNPIPAAPTAGSNSPVCLGSSILLTSNTVAGATYSWTGPLTYTSALEDPTRASATAGMAGTYSVTVTVLGCTSLAGTTAVVTSSSFTPTNVISASPSGAICAGTSVTFTATAGGGGTTPTYQWQVNGSNVGTSSTTYTSSTLTNGQVVTCILTSSSTCATTPTVTSSGITMVVNPLLVPSVSIAASPAGAICSGTSVTFTATPTNGGATPTYQWQVNGVNVGTSSPIYTSAALLNGDVVTCIMTSNALCPSIPTVTSNAISMTVNSIVSPTITIALSSGTNPSCSGQPVTFTATITNGGTTPIYQWQVGGVNVGTNSSTFTTSSLVNGDSVTCTLTSNAPCPSVLTITSSAINMVVNPTPAAATITQSGSVLTSSSATGNQWYLNGVIIPGETNQTYTFTVNGTYTVVVTNGGCSSAASGPVVVIDAGVDAVENSFLLSVFPNPNDGNFTVSFNVPVKATYKLELTNALGQLIFKDELKDYTGVYKKQLSVVEYGKGVYTITLTNDKHDVVKKIIVY